jgi:hypothetical protein
VCRKWTKLELEYFLKTTLRLETYSLKRSLHWKFAIDSLIFMELRLVQFLMRLVLTWIRCSNCHFYFEASFHMQSFVTCLSMPSKLINSFIRKNKINIWLWMFLIYNRTNKPRNVQPKLHLNRNKHLTLMLFNTGQLNKLYRHINLYE